MTGDRGLSPASVKRYATVFASILTEAWRQKKIEVNPFEHAYIQYPKIVQPELEVYSDDEIALFIAELEEVSKIAVQLSHGVYAGELRQGITRMANRAGTAEAP